MQAYGGYHAERKREQLLMARRNLPSFAALWRKREQLYLTVFSTALTKLTEINSLTGNENKISKQLRIILNLVCSDLWKSERIEVQRPIWEAPIQPTEENKLTDCDDQKRPDFTCPLVFEEHEIAFHVECKRLGNPTSASWVLNKNYVTNGIKRFDSITHEYGKQAFSGLMIGYIISMSPSEISDQVNNFQKTYLPDNAPVTFDFNPKSPFQTRQKLNRKNVSPNKFELIHLWVDLTNNYHATPNPLSTAPLL